MWSQFVSTWNSTIKRRPQTVLSTFLASQSVSWLGLFATYSAFPLGILPPELAIGLLVSKLTSKLRQPVNLTLAAGFVQVVPTITTMKVSPLITGFVADEKASAEFAIKRKSLEETYPFMKSGIGNVEKAAQWIQGPVDKYGLALYLSSRISGVTTVLSVTLLAQHGFDVPGLLSEYGFHGTPLSASVASLAAASVTNSLFTPGHFMCAVYGTKAQERLASEVIRSMSLEDIKKQRQTDEEVEEYSEEYEAKLRKETEDSILMATSMALLGTSFLTTMYAIKVMGSAGIDTFASPQDIDTSKSTPS